MSEYTENYSIWLMPKGSLANKLQTEINILADKYQAPVFHPHVTLLPDIKQSREQTIATAAKLAQVLKKYYITFQNVEYGATYFQCVYLSCAKDTDTLQAAATARELYSMGQQPYMPHLSLIYSDIDSTEREKVVQTEVQRLYGEKVGYATLLTETGFMVDSVALWFTPTEDKSLASWCQVAEFPLYN